MTVHTIIGGKVRLYRRSGSRYWQCAGRFNGQNFRVSTKEESLARAKEFAEDWYLELRGMARVGELKHEKTFRQAAERYLIEYEVITAGTRNPIYVQGNKRRLDNYLIPFFGGMGLSEVTAGKIQDYRVWRLGYSVPRFGKTDQPPPKKPPAKNTIHQEIVTLRQVLKTAIRHGWLTHLPDFSTPYKSAEKISRRAWFSPDEYKQLYEATRRRLQRHQGKRYEYEAGQLHDLVLFMANTGLRPDEVKRLQYRDVTIVDDLDTGETILEIEVRGKRGVGYCKSMTGAVRPFERLVQRNKPQPSDPIFPTLHSEMFNRVLAEEDLKFDREGQRRTLYSLRHTYISLRLMEGADIYQVAKNCRTSVEMIEKHYAAHIKTSINAAAVNVRRKKRRNPVYDIQDEDA